MQSFGTVCLHNFSRKMVHDFCQYVKGACDPKKVKTPGRVRKAFLFSEAP